MSASVRAWHRHHARLLFILGSSWSLENHQLLYVCLLGCPRTLTGPLLDLLKKGTLVKVEGFFEVNQYVGKDEKEHQTIVWKATAIEKKETQEA